MLKQLSNYYLTVKLICRQYLMRIVYNLNKIANLKYT